MVREGYFSSNEKQVLCAISRKATDVFNIVPKANLYRFNAIITGVSVGGTTMYAVAPNTFRGFHKTAEAKARGISGIEVYRNLIISNKDLIIKSLKECKSIEELSRLEDSLCLEFGKKLQGIVKPAMLNSYNKLRKVIDLTIEHVVSMADELDSVRAELSKLLFLPLDSQIFESEYIFTQAELSANGVCRSSTYSDVYSSKQYIALQEIALEKARMVSEYIGLPFSRIYFDLLWNKRYMREDARNLFMTNPK